MRPPETAMPDPDVLYDAWASAQEVEYERIRQDSRCGGCAWFDGFEMEPVTERQIRYLLGVADTPGWVVDKVLLHAAAAVEDCGACTHDGLPCRGSSTDSRDCPTFEPVAGAGRF